MWVPQIHSMREAIWLKIRDGVTVERDEGGNSSYVFLDIPLHLFRIFGFLDNTGFRLNAPGINTRREMGFIDDVQRSFYSGYFSGHGLKVQALTLPNGMIGSIFVAAWRESDAGILNMSGLDAYLSNLFREYQMQLPDGQLPAVYGDGIFPQRATIVARLRNPDMDQRRINYRMSSARQSIEHLFCNHHNHFKLFHNPERLRLLKTGVETYQIVFNSFLIFNCLMCFNESNNSFHLRPPSIEEYLPLEQIIPPAPEVTDDDLGEVYYYYR